MAAPVVLPASGPGASAYAQALEAQFEDPDKPKRKRYTKETGPSRKLSNILSSEKCGIMISDKKVRENVL